MRRVLTLALLAVATALGVVWAQQQPTQLPPSSPVEVRPGQRARPGEGREPEWPAPRITEYKPRTTLVVPAHPRPRAKFPVIDIHSHQPTPISAAEFARVVEGMDAEQPPPAGQPERRLRRAAEGRARGHSGEQVSGSDGALRERRFS